MTPATTSRGARPSTTWSAATTSSSPPPASPTAIFCRGPLSRGGKATDRVAGHALALGDRPHGCGDTRPGEAPRGHRRPLRLAAVRGSRPRRTSVADRRSDRLHRPPARARSSRASRAQSCARSRADARRRPRPGGLRGRRGRRARAGDAQPALEGVDGRLLPGPLDGPRRRRRLRRARPARRPRTSARRRARPGWSGIVYLGGLADGGVQAPAPAATRRRGPSRSPACPSPTCAPRP